MNLVDWGKDVLIRVHGFFYTHLRGYWVLAGILVSIALTVTSGIIIAQRMYLRGLVLIVLSVLIMKPSLLYLLAWLERRRAQRRSTGPSDQGHDG